MKGMKTRVESDDETVVKHQRSDASPNAAVLMADTCSNNGVNPDDHIRQESKNPCGQVCLTCKYGLPCSRSLYFACLVKFYIHVFIIVDFEHLNATVSIFNTSYHIILYWRNIYFGVLHKCSVPIL